MALDGNAGLYDATGITRFLGLLRRGGVLAYWSASASPGFAERLQALADVEAIEVEDEIAPGREGSAWLYLATRRGDQ